jgi:formate/nitrite transporter FocA (FNT family)
MTGAQIALIWLGTAPISLFEFRHSIVGSVEAAYVALLGDISWAHALGGFILPAVLGNIVGGFVFVALLNHGQVAADRRARAENQDPFRSTSWHRYASSESAAD